jgi:hypothetical protein
MNIPAPKMKALQMSPPKPKRLFSSDFGIISLNTLMICNDTRKRGSNGKGQFYRKRRYWLHGFRCCSVFSNQGWSTEKHSSFISKVKQSRLIARRHVRCLCTDFFILSLVITRLQKHYFNDGTRDPEP